MRRQKQQKHARRNGVVRAAGRACALGTLANRLALPARFCPILEEPRRRLWAEPDGTMRELSDAPASALEDALQAHIPAMHPAMRRHFLARLERRPCDGATLRVYARAARPADVAAAHPAEARFCVLSLLAPVAQMHALGLAHADLARAVFACDGDYCLFNYHELVPATPEARRRDVDALIALAARAGRARPPSRFAAPARAFSPARLARARRLAREGQDELEVLRALVR